MIHGKTTILPVLTALVLCCAACSALKEGDLLFHMAVSDNRITAVTPGMIDHVAIYAGGDSVVEAIPRLGVVSTPLHRLLQREDGYYLRGRVKGADGGLTVGNARHYLGLPYDTLYLQHNGAVYCSELVLLACTNRQGQRLLAPVPMTFRDSTGTIPAYWQQLYARHGMGVPEGQPGSNPGEMARRKEIVIKKLK